MSDDYMLMKGKPGATLEDLMQGGFGTPRSAGLRRSKHQSAAYFPPCGGKRGLPCQPG